MLCVGSVVATLFSARILVGVLIVSFSNASIPPIKRFWVKSMWLVILGYGAVIATALWYVNKAKGEDLCLNYLATILWGATLMFFIDHLFSYIRG